MAPVFRQARQREGQEEADGYPGDGAAAEEVAGASQAQPVPQPRGEASARRDGRHESRPGEMLPTLTQELLIPSLHVGS